MTTRNLLIALLFVLAPLCASADAYSFSTDPQTVAVGVASGAITVSASASVAQTTCLLVSSNSATGQFSSSATTWNSVSAITMSKGTSNRSFFYQDSTAGTYALTVRVAPKPDSVSASCTSWSGAAAAVVATITQSIAVGASSAQTQTQSQSGSTAQSTTSATTQSSSNAAQAQSQSQGGAGPPPITARITTDAAAVAGAGTMFAGEAFGAQGEPLVGARYLWNFGDGAMGEGQQVWHTYAYPGTYDVLVSAGYNYSSGSARLAVAAVAAQVSLVAEGDGSLTVYNETDYDLDIGGWTLRQGTSTFMVPGGTILLRGKGVRFASAVLAFAGDEHATFHYANGTLAASATVGASSPLRGQVVEAPGAASAKQASAGYGNLPAGKSPEVGSPSLAKPPAKTSSPTPTVLSADQAAAAGAAPVNEVEWSYWLALAAVIAIGAVGSYYAYIPRTEGAQTLDPADEFDIE